MYLSKNSGLLKSEIKSKVVKVGGEDKEKKLHGPCQTSHWEVEGSADERNARSSKVGEEHKRRRDMDQQVMR